MTVLGLNYSQEMEKIKKNCLQQNVAHAPVRVARTTTGLCATAAIVLLAGPTGGLSLLAATSFGIGTTNGIADCVEKYECGDFQINNSKGSTIKLVNEISETNNLLGKKADSETRELEARVEQAKPSYISMDNCKVM